MKMKLLLIIPAYNEEDNIVGVVESIIEEYPEFDYVVINDGSTDHTSSRCHKNQFNIIDLPVNLGLAGAFQTGLRYAYAHGYDCAIQFDADGQHKPEYIKLMISELEKGYDIVIGSRFVEQKKPFSLRMAGSYLISGAIKLTTGKKIYDPTSGMRILNKAMIKEFAMNLNYGPEPDTISYLLKQGAKISEVQVQMQDRVNGTSYLTITKSVLYMLRMLLSILIVQNFRKRNDKYIVMKR
jgi:glycosyltransferase involved in cell wall biosynthesis